MFIYFRIPVGFWGRAAKTSGKQCTLPSMVCGHLGVEKPKMHLLNAKLSTKYKYVKYYNATDNTACRWRPKLT